MSRPLTLISCVVALAAGVGAALAAAAPARSDTHMIICPLEPNDAIIPPCCGPPIVTTASSPAFPCCGTPQPINCPAGLTLSSSADPSVAGQKITLSGRWPGDTAGQTVNLFQELPGARTFSKVAQTKTGSLGDFQFVRKGVKTNRSWYVAVGSERSLTISQRVKAVVTLTRTFVLRVVPNHACEQAVLEQRSPSGWHAIGKLEIDGKRVTSSGGRFCSSVSAGSMPGTFRAVFKGDRRNIRSVSNTVHR